MQYQLRRKRRGEPRCVSVSCLRNEESPALQDLTFFFGLALAAFFAFAAFFVLIFAAFFALAAFLAFATLFALATFFFFSGDRTVDVQLRSHGSGGEHSEDGSSD